ncbi:hypothetical protein JVU11DRAFT_12136 [Chiua virens]|nr:hypothetical protein JVU11DRAFT_12136 [Chiua virens]
MSDMDSMVHIHLQVNLQSTLHPARRYSNFEDSAIFAVCGAKDTFLQLEEAGLLMMRFVDHQTLDAQCTSAALTPRQQAFRHYVEGRDSAALSQERKRICVKQRILYRIARVTTLRSSDLGALCDTYLYLFFSASLLLYKTVPGSQLPFSLEDSIPIDIRTVYYFCAATFISGDAGDDELAAQSDDSEPSDVSAGVREAIHNVFYLSMLLKRTTPRSMVAEWEKQAKDSELRSRERDVEKV